MRKPTGTTITIVIIAAIAGTTARSRRICH